MATIAALRNQVHSLLHASWLVHSLLLLLLLLPPVLPVLLLLQAIDTWPTPAPAQLLATAASYTQAEPGRAAARLLARALHQEPWRREVWQAMAVAV